MHRWPPKANSEKLLAVVDEDTLVLESIAELMTSAEYGLAPFVSVKALLEDAHQSGSGYLVSDIGMQRIDVGERASSVRGAHRELSLVFITIHKPGDFDVCAHMIQLSPVSLLPKPFDSKELLSAVTEARTELGDVI